MPHKICPECDASHGVRRLQCDCGYEFRKSKKKSANTSAVPEPGNWVFDTDKGMPKIHPPATLDGSMLSVDEVSEHVAYEGLGYCIYAYIPPGKIQDKKLADLWRKAQAEMRKVQSYLMGHAHG